LRLTALSFWFLAGGLAFPAPATSAPSASNPIQEAYRSGRYLPAATNARAALETAPDDADLHAMLAVCLSRMGFYADALAEFPFGLGSPIHEEDGVGAEAEALRATGHPMDAMSLRLTRLVTTDSSSVKLAILLGTVDDARAAGDGGLAEDQAWQALSLDPDSSFAWAYLADVALDRGDFPEAGFALWRAFDTPQPSVRAWLVQGRLGLLTGDLPLAFASASAARELRPRAVSVALLQAEVLRRLGRLDQADEILHRGILEVRQQPAIFAMRGFVHADLGQFDLGREDVAEGLALYPHDALLGRAAERVGLRRHD
jgi:tetratricopeptide (TPR) repeat protein